MEHIDGGAHLVAARDRAVAAVVHAFGRGRLDDEACARLLDEVQAAPDVATLDEVLERLGGGAVPGTRALVAEDLVSGTGDRPGRVVAGPGAAGAVGRHLDPVDLALAARAARLGADRHRDPRMVSLVVVVVVLVALAVLGVVLISAVRTDVTGSGPGAAPVTGPAHAAQTT